MDPGRSSHPAQAPASTLFVPTMQSLAPSANLTSAVSPPNPLNMSSKPASQAFTAPLQSTSGAAPAFSQSQPLTQVMNTSSASGFPVASQATNSDAIPRSETMPAAQSAADLYPHQVDGLGGPTATAPFLQDFNLVAEAVKRAQMGIVMRDLESVTL